MSEYAPIRTWIPVQSSNLSKVWYDPEEEILKITFDPVNARGHRTGIPRTYGYSGVPMRIFLGLLAAGSKGKYHDKHIKYAYVYTELAD